MAGPLRHALTQYARRLAATEPAAIAEAVRLVLLALAALGAITIPDATLQAVIAAVGVLGSILLTGAVRTTVDSPATRERRRRAPH